MHQLTEEWKQTSTRTIQKLEEQIGTYQEKLTLLEQRQIELVEENHSLKEQLDQRGTKKNKKVTHRPIASRLNRFVQKKKPSKDRQASPPPPITTPTRQPSVDDSLQQQISLQNMFDAIKVRNRACCVWQWLALLSVFLQTAEVYGSIDDYNESEKILLRDFCHVSSSKKKKKEKSVWSPILDQG